MFYEDASTARLGVAYGGETRFTAQQYAEMFERLVITNLIAGSLTPYLAQEWASKAHHYAALALREKRDSQCRSI